MHALELHLATRILAPSALPIAEARSRIDNPKTHVMPCVCGQGGWCPEFISWACAVEQARNAVDGNEGLLLHYEHTWCIRFDTLFRLA